MIDLKNVPLTAIETVSGVLVDLADPKIEDFHAVDIAWALSREPRFGGHTITSLIYSVGQHSIHVSRILEEIWSNPIVRASFLKYDASSDLNASEFMQDYSECPGWLQLYGLLHDASEAYLRDLPSPVKALPGLREAYLEREAAIMDLIFEKFKLLNIKKQNTSSWKIASSMVHWADMYARTIEAYHFMPSRGAHWKSSQKVQLIDLHEFEMPKSSLTVFQEFLERLDELQA